MLVDCLIDLSAKWNLINFESESHYDTYLAERCIIFLGYIYPTVGYFIVLIVSPTQIGIYYFGLTNSQTIWMAGAFLAIIHTSNREIWTVKLTLFLLLGLVGNTLLTSYTADIAVYIFYYAFILCQVVLFLFLYARTVLLARRRQAKNRFSSSDYFCVMYSSLIFFMFLVQVVIPGIISEFYGDEVFLIYTNIALVVCITLASIIPNRAKQIKLQSTEQSLAMRQAFVRYLSHEMRTPINVALVGLTIHEQYLAENELLNSECQEVLLDVRNAIGESLDTLNEVLNYEKLQSKVMVLEKKQESPVPFVVSSLNMFRMPAQNKGIHLVLPQVADYLDLQQSCIEVDPHKMSQVLRNFVSNAVKFSHSGGTITVSMRSGELQQLCPSSDLHSQLLLPDYLDSCLQLRHRRRSSVSMYESWLEISVTDTGIGIAPENIHRVFNEVIQIKPNENQGGNGSGMGLYISKGIAELHGGAVEVRSDGLGRGCRFSLLLPLREMKEEASEGVASTALLSEAPPPLDARRRVDDSRVFPFERDDLEMQRRTTDDDPFTQSLQQLTLSGEGSARSSGGGWVSQNSKKTDRSTALLLLRGDSSSGQGRAYLPIDPAAAVAAASVTGGEVMIGGCEGSSNTITQTLFVTESSSSRSLDGGGVLSGRKILMVDDSPPNLKLCVRLFQKLGAVVEKAEDGLIALNMVQRLLQEERQQQVGVHRVVLYDLVVMDNLMPRMCGPEACKKMRDVGFAGLIIGLTGNALEQDIAEYMAQGASAVLKKPLVLEELFEIVRSYQ